MSACSRDRSLGMLCSHSHHPYAGSSYMRRKQLTSAVGQQKVRQQLVNSTPTPPASVRDRSRRRRERTRRAASDVHREAAPFCNTVVAQTNPRVPKTIQTECPFCPLALTVVQPARRCALSNATLPASHAPLSVAGRVFGAT